MTAQTEPPGLNIASMLDPDAAAVAALELANVQVYVTEQVEGTLNRVLGRITGLETVDEVQEMVMEEFTRGQVKETT